MTLKTYIVTIEDIYGFNHNVEVVANNSYDAVHALRHANYHIYGNGVVVNIEEKTQTYAK